MRKFLTQYRAPLRFTLALLPVAAAAGYLVIRYQLALYDPATLAAMLAQLGSTAVLLAVGTAQTVVYAAVCGFFGYLLAEKLGLMRPFRLEKRPLLRTLAVSLPLVIHFGAEKGRYIAMVMWAIIIAVVYILIKTMGLSADAVDAWLNGLNRGMVLAGVVLFTVIVYMGSFWIGVRLMEKKEF